MFIGHFQIFFYCICAFNAYFIVLIQHFLGLKVSNPNHKELFRRVSK